ncbi:Uncharacterised protein [Corynebacterium diphtheriae]|nr:Uncharacterised protein [Corynebacterium diphtheriae]
MRKLPVQQDRSALLDKARVYSPTWHPVTEPVAEVIRTVLVRGVQCHGQGSIVAGIPTYRVLCEVGGLLACFLPEVLALGVDISEPQAWLTPEWASWWETGDPAARTDTRRRQARLLELVRVWMSSDPVAAYLEDALTPKRRANRFRTEPPPPYSLHDLARIFAWPEQLPTDLARHRATVVVALAFGAGLNASEIRAVKPSSISPSADTVRLDGATLPVRPEVRLALDEVRSCGLFPFNCLGYVSHLPPPAGVKVTTSRLRLTWALAEFSEGATFEDVSQRVGAAVAKRAAIRLPQFRSWPDGRELQPLVKPVQQAGQENEVGRQEQSPNRPRPAFRLIQGGT